MIIWSALIYSVFKMGKVKVIDLTEMDIDKACDELISQFDCSFDLAVGIADGGKIVAEKIALKTHLPLLIVKRQRSLTNKKNRIKAVFKYIPKRVLNFFRVLESSFYQLSLKRKKRKDKSGEIQMCCEDCSFLETKSIKNVLLIDDALDSGATILDVEKFFEPKHWNFKVAVITQTFNQPLINADYKIYNKTLIRFPWSSDCVTKKNDD